MAQLVGVGPTAVSNAVKRGAFPPAWFKASETIAQELGVECPPELFGQKLVSSQSVNCGSKSQEGNALSAQAAE